MRGTDYMTRMIPPFGGSDDQDKRVTASGIGFTRLTEVNREKPDRYGGDTLPPRHHPRSDYCYLKCSLGLS